MSLLGDTGVKVTKLAYGTIEVGGGIRQLDESDVGAILHQVLDAGINLIDTAPDYGEAEQRIGRHISHRRDEFFLASKCGCPVDPLPPSSSHSFTRRNIRLAVEQSLRRMRTDRIDLVQFHASPTREVLGANDSLAELAALRSEGKIRFVGVSGTLPNVLDHIDMGVFDVFQLPYSALEREHERPIIDAAAAGAGTIVRGGIGRGVPDRSAVEVDRLPPTWQELMLARAPKWSRAQLDDFLDGSSRRELMLRFTLSHPAVDTMLIGTASPEHLAQNVAAACKGPLPADVYAEVIRRLPATPDLLA